MNLAESLQQEDPKLTRQAHLEEMMVGLGIHNYNRYRDRHQEADMSPGKALISRNMGKMVRALEEYVEDAVTGQRGRLYSAVKYLLVVDLHVASYLALRTCLTKVVSDTRPKLTAVAMSVASQIDNNERMKQFKKDAPDLYHTTFKEVQKATTARHRQAVLRHAQKRVETVKGLEWTPPESLRLGLKLVETVISATGLLELRTVRVGRKSVDMLMPTQAVAEWLETMHHEQAMLNPVFLPMVVPPRDWEEPLGNPYLDSDLVRTVPLLRCDMFTELNEEVHNIEMPIVYDAVNYLQRVPLRINKALHAVISQLKLEESHLGHLPRAHDMPPPPRPEGLPEGVRMQDLPPHQQTQLRQWKMMVRDTHEENHKEISRRLAFAQQLYLASEMSDDEEIYFPYSLDFRGRVYTLPTGLTPQGDDKAKALLEFAKGKPLGEDGAYWLAVHLANTYGDADKLPLDERVQWTLDHEDEILESAINPLDGSRWWTKADGGGACWQMLAACLEWSGYVLSGRSEDYVSHLPVCMDGTCSGLQHFSALLRDAQGGASVNLTPSEECRDIYSEIAAAVEVRLNDPTLALDADPEALEVLNAWKGKVVRKIVKTPCMTFAYSVTPTGVRGQILDGLQSLDPAGGYLGGIDYRRGASALAPVVMSCIRETVVAAAAAMDWLQEAAAALASENRPLLWTTPCGMPVEQAIKIVKSKKVEAFFGGRRKQLSIGKPTKVINKRGQKSAVAPNFVHSMDASHLMMTVLECARVGITDMVVVHDSFGTHACNVSEMNHCIRETFVQLYQGNDWLQDFKEGVEEQLDDPSVLPPLPSMGTLDVASVRESDFFFS